jgi:CheY-like chemotaxis protein
LRLQQALLNYLSNAVKFTEQGEIAVSVALESQDAEEARIRFAVRDTGIGVSAETMTRLFTPFEQADASITRKYGGTGLGLALTRQLAGKMGGEAGVESIEGGGSTFWFTVALKRELAEQAAPAVATNAEEPAETALKRIHAGRRVLVADDSPINRELAVHLLSGAGFHVDTVENGIEAIRQAASETYAAILMDLQMPHLDGLAATRQLRGQIKTADVPILAMTANAFAEDREQCLAAGMNDLVSKPIDPPVLFATLLRWLPA